MKKVVVSDYDQTLNMGDISLKYNLYRTNKFLRNGNLFVISTGRNFESIKREIKKYNIKFSYLCCCDGAEIYDNKYNLLLRKNLTPDDLTYISDTVKNFETAKILNGHFAYGEVKKEEPLVNIVAFKGLKGFFTTEETKKLIELIKQNPNLTVENYLGSLFISNIYANKSKCIEYLCEMLDLEKMQVFTIGDYKNDYSMIRDYNGFSMPWAVKSVKEASLKTYLLMGNLPKDIEEEKESFIRKLKYK